MSWRTDGRLRPQVELTQRVSGRCSVLVLDTECPAVLNGLLLNRSTVFGLNH